MAERPAKRARRGGDTPAGTAEQPLRGVKFAVSVDASGRGGDGGGDGGDDSDGDAVNFASVRSRGIALGGTYCATVHKRVAVLLASDAAARRRTQRVRKASKVGVPVVDAVGYLDACGDGAAPDAETYALYVAPAAAVLAAGETRGKLDANAGWDGSTTYDGGCCCSCHDGGAASCEWCAASH